MSGTPVGGKRAAQTNVERYGKGFYKNIGTKGGSTSHPSTRVFYLNRELARQAGAKGGTISRRNVAKEKAKREAENE